MEKLKRNCMTHVDKTLKEIDKILEDVDCLYSKVFKNNFLLNLCYFYRSILQALLYTSLTDLLLPNPPVFVHSNKCLPKEAISPNM